MNMHLFTQIKNYLSTRKDFKIMEQNLKDFLKSDRTHLPSDGGLFERIYKLNDRNLIKKYQKKAGKILRPAIEQYFKEDKFKQRKVKNCIDINDYLNMTKQDLYEEGIDFFIPVANQIIYNNETYYMSSKKVANIMGAYLELSISPIVPEFSAPNGHYINCPMPPLPLEYVFVLKQLFLEKYIDILSSKDELTEEQIKKIITPDINEYDSMHSYLI